MTYTLALVTVDAADPAPLLGRYRCPDRAAREALTLHRAARVPILILRDGVPWRLAAERRAEA